VKSEIPAVPLPASKRQDNSNKLLFYDLCQIFASIEETQGKEKKLKLIFNKTMKEKIKGQSPFPFMRLLLPLIDSERMNYNLKQQSVAKTYIKVLNITSDSGDAQSLLHYKNQEKNQGNKSDIISGDFGTILEHILSKRSPITASKTTVGEVNTILDAVAAASSEGEGKAGVIRDQILYTLVTKFLSEDMYAISAYIDIIVAKFVMLRI
jgi:DNA ligase-4